MRKLERFLQQFKIWKQFWLIYDVCRVVNERTGVSLGTLFPTNNTSHLILQCDFIYFSSPSSPSQNYPEKHPRSNRKVGCQVRVVGLVIQSNYSLWAKPNLMYHRETVIYNTHFKILSKCQRFQELETQQLIQSVWT